MNTKMRARLILSGGDNFEPNDIEVKYGIKPDIVWHCGESIGPTVFKRTDNAWVKSTGPHKKYDHGIGLCLRELFERTEDIRALLVNNKGLALGRKIVIELEVHEGLLPEMCLAAADVRKISDIKAQLEMDILLVAEDDE